MTARERRGAAAYQDLSLHIPATAMVAVTGPQAGGQSGLLAILAGAQRPAQGQVEIDGVSLYDHREALIPQIGYVPALATATPDLTVAEFLSQAAGLRLPRGTGDSEQRPRIAEVLAALDLQDQQAARLGALSPALRWRTLVAAELIADPGLLLIDEPAGNLDPGAELILMELLRRLDGRRGTVVMATHSSQAIGMADRVIVLAPGGHLAWYGPPREALAYFENFSRRPTGLRTPFGFDDIDALLVNPQAGTPAEWATRYKSQPAYRLYIEDPLLNTPPGVLPAAQPMAQSRGEMAGGQPPPSAAGAGLRQQVAVHLGRTFKLFLRDRPAIALACALPLVVAAAWWLVVSPWMYGSATGSAMRETAAGAVLAGSILLTAAFVGWRVIIKHQVLPRRTARRNQPILPYIVATLALVFVIAFVQALVWAGASAIGAGLPGKPVAGQAAVMPSTAGVPDQGAPAGRAVADQALSSKPAAAAPTAARVSSGSAVSTAAPATAAAPIAPVAPTPAATGVAMAGMGMPADAATPSPAKSLPGPSAGPPLASPAPPGIEVQDQPVHNAAIVVAQVVSHGDSWLVIHPQKPDGSMGDYIGYTLVHDGASTDVVVHIDAKRASPTLYAMLHADVSRAASPQFPGIDAPVMVDGKMVLPAFHVLGAPAGDVPITVHAGSGGLPHLADGFGLSLYIFLGDAPGQSPCTDSCLASFRPLLETGKVAAGNGVAMDKLGAVVLPDGTRQVAYGGAPLYYNVNDRRPGDEQGQGTDNLWFLVTP